LPLGRFAPLTRALNELPVCCRAIARSNIACAGIHDVAISTTMQSKTHATFVGIYPLIQVRTPGM